MATEYRSTFDVLRAPFDVARTSGVQSTDGVLVVPRSARALRLRSGCPECNRGTASRLGARQRIRPCAGGVGSCGRCAAAHARSTGHRLRRRHRFRVEGRDRSPEPRVESGERRRARRRDRADHRAVRRHPSYAVKLFENHGRGIGEKGKDNGLLILLALDERQVWIEVGYGLEQWITDGFAGETSRDDMVPEFRAGRYGPGLLAGATRIVGRIAQGRNVTLEGVETPQERPRRNLRFRSGCSS